MASCGKRYRWLAALIGALFVGPQSWAEQPDLRELLPALDAPAPSLRVATLVQLSDLAQHHLNSDERQNLASQLGSRLARLGQDPDGRIQQAALEAITRLGVEVHVAIPAYEHALLAMELKPRQIVAEAVAQRLKSSVADLQQGDTRGDRVRVAADCLRDAQLLAPLCGRLLADRDANIRQKTVLACDGAWQGLAKFTSLGDDSNDSRYTPLLRQELPKIARAWAELAPAFVPLLQQGALAERIAAGRTLEALAHLLQSWERQALKWGLTAEQVQGLRAANQNMSTLVPGLLAALPGAPTEVQLATLGVIEGLEGDAEPARPFVLDMVASAKSSFVRWNCLRILAQLSPARSGEEWNRVSALLTDDDGDVRAAALRVLAGWATAPHTEEMILAAQNSPHGNSPGDRRASVLALASMIEKGTAAEQLSALRVLGRMGDEAGPALPSLKVALQKAKPDIRRAIPDVLGSIGQPAQYLLEGALTDGDEEVRLASARALSRLRR